MDRFMQQYLETAEWADSPDPKPEGWDDAEWSPEALERAQKECAQFRERMGEIDDETQAAHDFWLTRNGHGAGFWDGDWPEPEASRLDALAKSFGECDVYMGDDGLLCLG